MIESDFVRQSRIKREAMQKFSDNKREYLATTKAKEFNQPVIRDAAGNVDKSVVYRQWGYYKVLEDGDGYAVKRLVILPGRSLSDQKHFKRQEHWVVVSGELSIVLEGHDDNGKELFVLEHTQSIDIELGVWHRPYNDGNAEVMVIETWLGDSTEEDIERRHHGD